MDGLRIDVAGDDALAAKLRALEEVDESLPVAFQRTIRVAAVGLAQEAQARALEEPALGEKHTGLRAEVSSGVGLDPLPGGIRISTSMPNTDEAIIPRGLDSGRGWRHPVFGHRGTWVRQYGAFSWFTDTIEGGADGIERGLVDSLDAAADKIDRA